MPINDWYEQRKKDTAERKVKAHEEETGEAGAIKCSQCGEILLLADFESNFRVCSQCGKHFYLPPVERIKLLLDKGVLKEFCSEMKAEDPLKFEARKTYRDSLDEAVKKTGFNEAFMCGEGKISDIPVIFGILDFNFIGGSMGFVVGEKIAQAAEKALAQKKPLIIVSASGGARMQEGMISLLQMAKTAAAIARFESGKKPFISLLTHPTSGGVIASFASLADIILAEPEVFIGFTGPRIIEQTIKQKLPKGFQRAEFLLEHGMVDMITTRNRQKKVITQLLEMLTKG